MRTLDPLLAAEQLKPAFTPKYKWTLSKVGETSVILEDYEVIVESHIEEPWTQKANIVINNASRDYNGRDFTGWTLTPSYGAQCGISAKYSDCAPLLVVNDINSTILSNTPKNKTGGSELLVPLTALGIFDLMAEDKATEYYRPANDDTQTVQDLLNAVAGATLTCFSGCEAITLDFDSTDSLIGTYLPKDSFYIPENGSRLAAFKRLLEFTGCMSRIGADGHIHIFVPVTTGTVYDFEINLDTIGKENFYARTSQKNLVLPNYIIVKTSPDETPAYSGYASMGYAANAIKRKTYRYKVTSNAQATAAAQAILSQLQLNAQSGSAYCPMIMNLEVFDYVKITDSLSGDTVIGNVGKLTRKANPITGEYSITFSLGGWFSPRGILNELETYAGYDYESLRVRNLFLETLDIQWIDPDGNIDLSKIGDNLDNLPDGSNYGKVKSVHLDNGGLKIDENCVYAAGFDASGKRRVFTATPTTPYDIGDLWMSSTVTKICTNARVTGAYQAGDWSNHTLDAIADGTSYARLSSTDISAGHIKLTTAVTASGKWYNASGVVIDASTGILIYGTNKALVTRATVNGTDQCYVGSDGLIYAGAGCVMMGANGLEIRRLDSGNSGKLLFSDVNGTAIGRIMSSYGYAPNYFTIAGIVGTLDISGYEDTSLYSNVGDVILSTQTISKRVKINRLQISTTQAGKIANTVYQAGAFPVIVIAIIYLQTNYDFADAYYGTSNPPTIWAGRIWQSCTTGFSAYQPLIFVIPAYNYYKISLSGGAIFLWMESTIGG